MGEAADRYARVSRSQWEDYKARFQPLEDELFQAFDNPGLVQASLNDAGRAVEDSFFRANQNLEMNLSRYGLAETADQKRAVDRNAELAKTATLASARNMVRQRAKDRDKELALGSIPNAAGRDYSGGV